MTIPAILAIILLAVLVYQIGAGCRHVWRYELAKRRASRIVFPPQKTMEVYLGDGVPF